MFPRMLMKLVSLRTLSSVHSEQVFALRLQDKKLPPLLSEIWDVNEWLQSRCHTPWLWSLRWIDIQLKRWLLSAHRVRDWLEQEILFFFLLEDASHVALRQTAKWFCFHLEKHEHSFLQAFIVFFFFFWCWHALIVAILNTSIRLWSHLSLIHYKFCQSLVQFNSRGLMLIMRTLWAGLDCGTNVRITDAHSVEGLVLQMCNRGEWI